MRKKRVLLLAGVLLALSAVATLTVLRYLPGETAFLSRYDRLREGMTAAEVHAVMGPPISATNRPDGDLEEELYAVVEHGTVTDSATVAYTGGRVRLKHRERITPPSFAERARAWLRRLWP